MHASSRRILLVAMLLAPGLLAGCTGGGSDAEAVSPGTTTPPATGGGPPAARPTSFQIQGPTLRPLDGQDRPLREDDGARVTYTILLPSTAPSSATALVTYLFNGEVEDVESIQLAPGQSKSFERTIPEVRNYTELKIEVRAGSTSAKASGDVSEWPRIGEWLTMADYFHVMVEGWRVDPDTRETVVSAVMKRGVRPFSEFRSHILCYDEAGKVTSVGSVRPDVQPLPNGVEAFELRLPPCPHETYGVDFKADAEGGVVLYGRALFVPKGWEPPASA